MIISRFILLGATLIGAHFAIGVACADALNIVPDRFLRAWDPVTLFFQTPQVEQAGPEDEPLRYITLEPPHPGSYTWLDRQTLQFRPAQAWPPLAQFIWRNESTQTTLQTLMRAPIKTHPSANAANLPPVDHLLLSFHEPIDPAILAQTLQLALTPAPGVGTQSHTLNQHDFSIKPLERKRWSDPAQYRIELKQTIPENTHVEVQFQLSTDPDLDAQFHRYRFTTRRPFRVTHIGCRQHHYVIPTQGAHYAQDQSIACNSNNRALTVTFNAKVKPIDPVTARNLIRLSPSVDNLRFSVSNDRLTVSGDFLSDTLYQVALHPAPLTDRQDRPLSMPSSSDLYVYFPAQANFIQWRKSTGLLERFGPQMFPLGGRGHEKIDIRIHRIDPLDRTFWPFPNNPIRVDEALKPPAPGEQPSPFTSAQRNTNTAELKQQIHYLGTPNLSDIITLPLRDQGKAQRFGLDLAPLLKRVSGTQQAGTYLVGLRPLDAPTDRHWVRLQVTDLSLTTIETERHVEFVVTSLLTGLPVADALIRVEGAVVDEQKWRWSTLINGRTDTLGRFKWVAPGNAAQTTYVRRIVVTKASDALVLDPSHAPKQFRNNHWRPSYANWLQWTQENLTHRAESERTVCHVFSERPMYKPAHAVHLKGYIRTYYQGHLSTPSGAGALVIDGPDGRQWRQPIEINDFGSFYYHFDEENLASGEYRFYFEYTTKTQSRTCGDGSFQKEVYQLPKFEVSLHGADTVPLDQPFPIKLAANYYAGGMVAKRPVRWRVNQFPYTWRPQHKRQGFYYSTDGRFSGYGALHARPAMEKTATTDHLGGAELLIDPTLEPTAQARRYVIEATVIGDDDQTVTDSKQVLALPPFTLALKAPRYAPHAKQINPQAMVVDAQGKAIVGQKVTLRLHRRQWHNRLQATDFSRGKAEYVSDVVDETVFETQFDSSAEPTPFQLPIDQAGVYIVEIEATDRLGRAQRVSVDLYAGGEQAVTWSQPPTEVFQVSTDKNAYEPGETAQLILQSPFQNAHVLAIVERPDQSNIYRWLRVEKGQAVFEVPIDKQYMPKVPVHFILLRGRVGSGKPHAKTGMDLGKPTTLAATQWITVKPTEHRLNVTLTYPKKAQPGTTVPIDIALSDQHGKPVVGEVTLWLVDQAVLALAREARIDPLPDFIIAKDSTLQLRDTRNSVLGFLPMQDYPGGDAGEAENDIAGLLDRVTLRKNFKPVPFYQPNILTDADGKARVLVTLPDNLSNFKLRAKVVSVADRFGYATGMLAIRLPFITQPALPNFARPGDHFTAQAIVRVVDGQAGEGRAEFAVTGASTASTSVEIALDGQTATKVPLIVRVDKITTADSLQFAAAVIRNADQAQDGFSVSIPIHPNHQPFTLLNTQSIEPGQTLALAPTKKAGYTLQQRQLLLAKQPGIVKMATALDFLLHYPYGCTEQRVSAARAQMAISRFHSHLGLEDPTAQQQLITETLLWLETTTDAQGLVSFWPGGNGQVALTAWSLQFLLEAQAADYTTNDTLAQRLIASLKRALRSDVAASLSETQDSARIWALTALAQAGELDPHYATELARKAQFLDLESLSQVITVLAQTGPASQAWVEQLIEQLLSGFVFQQHQGTMRYAGLQHPETGFTSLLGSEARTIAQAITTLAQIDGEFAVAEPLLAALLNLYEAPSGWGHTNANAAAILALSERLFNDEALLVSLNLRLDAEQTQYDLGDSVVQRTLPTAQTGQLTLSATAPGPIVAQTRETFISRLDTQAVPAQAQGFAVQRENLLLQDANTPPLRIDLQEQRTQLLLNVGDLVEEHIQLSNPQDRNHVAIVVPIAAGMRVLNPNLATASSDATPNGALTLAPTFVHYQHHQVAFFYDVLPKGLYHFYFRTQANVPGTFSQPPARCEMMYASNVFGRSAGAKVKVLYSKQRKNASAP